MIDSFYRIKALNDLGIKIYLHCFEYGRSDSETLKEVCERVYYYPRKTGLLSHFTFLPYIVSSRRAEKLLRNLIKDDFPVLFDGLQSTFYLKTKELKSRKKYIRMHNIEHRYYKSLAIRESAFFKKLYFIIESLKLKIYERVLSQADGVITISNIEQDYFNTKYRNATLITAFHPFEKCESLPGYGNYILFHGDLSVNENVAISDFLISEVFSKIPYSCIIAGKNPPGKLHLDASHYSNIKIVSNPDLTDMDQLIRNAHINLLPSFSNNGFRIKMLFALFEGRHCMANNTVTEGNTLGELCYTFNTGYAMVENIHHIMNLPFTEEMITKRNKLLSKHYSNSENAKMISKLIFPSC
jgi:glycosyltransferase involved in cell wall biosynthesis